LILSRSDLEIVLPMDATIEALDQAFRELVEGKATLIPRSSIVFPKQEGWIGIMPASVMNSFSTKIVTLYKRNLEKKLPTIMGTIVLNDLETGEVLSIMDGTYITAIRTGALGGLAAKHLSRKDSQIAGIFGAGTQARTQLTALTHVRDISRAFVYDTVPERTNAFAAEMHEKLHIPVGVAENPRAVLQASDIIVTVSTSNTPVFSGANLKPGTHINAFGNFKTDEREIDTETIVRSKVFVDLEEAALAEAGDIVIPIKEGKFRKEQIAGSIGEVLLGSKPGRTSNDDITLFKSVGLGIQDCAAASVAYRNALQKNMGTNIPLN
jgi:alanine dehydrogenase